jgi:hypothetical protein
VLRREEDGSSESIQSLDAFVRGAVDFSLPPGMPAVNGVCRSVLRVRDEAGSEVSRPRAGRPIATPRPPPLAAARCRRH